MFPPVSYTKRHMAGRFLTFSADESFDTFNLDYYSKTEKDRHGISPYENMRLIYSICFRFAEKFGNEYKNLLIMGKRVWVKLFYAIPFRGE